MGTFSRTFALASATFLLGTVSAPRAPHIGDELSLNTSLRDLYKKQTTTPTAKSLQVGSPLQVGWGTQIITSNSVPSLESFVKAQEHFIRNRKQQPSGHLYAGLPIVTSSNRVLTVVTNIGYVVGYEKARHQAAWVAYRLFRVPSKQPALKRPTSRFLADAKLDPDVVSNALRGTDFDSGHLAPNHGIATRYGEEAQRQTFMMYNVSPQRPLFNRKFMRMLEKLEADGYANAFEEVWVICGPVFDRRQHEHAGRCAIDVPDAFYRIMLEEDGAQIRALPLIVEHTENVSTNLAQYLTDIRSVEQRTGLDFNRAMPDLLEEAIETIRSTNLWSLPGKSEARNKGAKSE